MQGRPWMIAWIAVSFGVLAFVLVWRTSQTHESPADYCYQVRQGTVCMRQLADCETRASAEPAGSVTKTCAARPDDTLTP